MKRNQSAMAAACVAAILTLSGCSTVRSWMPWSDTRADGAAVKQSSSQQGYGNQAGSQGDLYRPLEVHEPR
ncbi:hypothetical protein [Comamonas endophytica]|uniref:Lipoprotein n=1 Tax=Comamonas endophytica TaxID=2949090 RepID=A0ABY6G6L0_9BURK|nr:MULTISPECIES: hypothetical protein [unclassified Acidovorax]MCD2511138.1 hypothetical protein [Acidovorax sp. D4N7]UYG50541.1 hypothetical protein M9799_10550 [Acidovorax sp. 5MLIR]